MPHDIQPLPAVGDMRCCCNTKLQGAGIGMALIDSSIHVNQDLIENGTNGLSLLNLFPNVAYAESFVPDEGVTTTTGTGHYIAGIIAGNSAFAHTVQNTATIFTASRPAFICSVKCSIATRYSPQRGRSYAIERAIRSAYLHHQGHQLLDQETDLREVTETDPLCGKWRRPGYPVSPSWSRRVTEADSTAPNTDGYGTIAAPNNDPLSDHRRRNEHREHGLAGSTGLMTDSIAPKGPV